MTFLTEVTCPARFTTGEEVASFVGLAPRVRRSGSVTRGGPIVKAGNPALRTVLVEAAWCWVRCDPAAKKIYRRLVANTASGQKAIVAVARHLAVLLWRIVTTGEVYTTNATELETDNTGPSSDSQAQHLVAQEASPWPTEGGPRRIERWADTSHRVWIGVGPAA